MEVSKRVLIVDDDQNALLMCRNLLSAHGFECYIAGGGQDALDLLTHMNVAALPHVIVTDFEMPVMTGIEMVVKLREIPHIKGIPIILISGGMNHQLSLDLVKSGVKQAMHKLALPMLPNILKTMLRI